MGEIKEEGPRSSTGGINIQRRSSTLLLRSNVYRASVLTSASHRNSANDLHWHHLNLRLDPERHTAYAHPFDLLVSAHPSSLSSWFWQDANRSGRLSGALLLEFGVHAIRVSNNNTLFKYLDVIGTVFDGGIYRPGSIEGNPVNIRFGAQALVPEWFSPGPFRRLTASASPTLP